MPRMAKVVALLMVSLTVSCNPDLLSMLCHPVSGDVSQSPSLVFPEMLFLFDRVYISLGLLNGRLSHKRKLPLGIRVAPPSMGFS